MKPIAAFAAKVNSKILLDSELVVERAGRFYMLSDALKSISRQDFFYSGLLLGKMKREKFFPSFNLLAMLAKNKANKVIVNEKAAWLFICGRDIFGKGIRTVQGSRRKGDFTLVLNVFGECIGFGRILHDLNSKDADVFIRNVSDVGDFLRRER